MNPADLIRLYPRLYHMAAPDAWPLIERHGLLSTEALLDLFDVRDPRRSELLTQRRPKSSRSSTRCTAPRWFGTTSR